MRMMRMRRRRRRRIILAGGLIALGTHKLRKEDVDRVEEHTGESADDLTDEELEQAMDELGIEDQETGDEDLEHVDNQDAMEGGESDYIDELERLAQLHEQGIITDEESANSTWDAPTRRIAAIVAIPIVATGREIFNYLYAKIQKLDPYPELVAERTESD